jgi:hypothetical protein
MHAVAWQKIRPDPCCQSNKAALRRNPTFLPGNVSNAWAAYYYRPGISDLR